jgi:hypothetical protein
LESHTGKRLTSPDRYGYPGAGPAALPVLLSEKPIAVYPNAVGAGINIRKRKCAVIPGGHAARSAATAAAVLILILILILILVLILALLTLLASLPAPLLSRLCLAGLLWILPGSGVAGVSTPVSLIVLIALIPLVDGKQGHFGFANGLPGTGTVDGSCDPCSRGL